MTCPLEKRLIVLLDSHAIRFTRPERDDRDPTNLDFYLPDFRIYIEVKQFHSDRISAQLSSVPERTTAILLMGPRAIEDFEKLCKTFSLVPTE